MNRPTEVNYNNMMTYAGKLAGQIENVSLSVEEKVITLSEAVRRFIKPEQSIYIGRLANAATAEIIRQFNGTNAHFTIIGGSRNFTSSLVHCGLVVKLIGNAFGELYPKPGPSYVIQRATEQGIIQIESWSELTLIQRFMAGAMGLTFMVSQVDISEGGFSDNRGLIVQIDDPFDQGKKATVVKPLVPDIAIVHGWMADKYGNIIMGQPNLSDQDIWGSLASRNNVVVTVEKIMPVDFMREHSCLVDIPGFLVKSVSEVPFGAHPQPMSIWGLGLSCDLKSYDVDIEFIKEYRKAAQNSIALNEWLNEWVFNCPTQHSYMNKIQEKYSASQTDVNDWQCNFHKKLRDTATYAPSFSNTEFMLVAAARKIRNIVKKENYKLMLAGMGQGGLSAYLAYYLARDEGYDIRLAVGLGIFGYSPRPGSPHTSTLENIATADMITTTLKGYGVYIGGMNNRCLSILGAAQIDKYGNINSTKTSTGKYLIGSGGAIDAVNAQEVLVVTNQSRDKLVDSVAFITSPGKKVRTLITDYGIYEKSLDGNEFILTEYLPMISQQQSDDAVVENFQNACGWEIKTASTLRRINPPTVAELALLRVFDPEELFLKKE